MKNCVGALAVDLVHSTRLLGAWCVALHAAVPHVVAKLALQWVVVCGDLLSVSCMHAPVVFLAVLWA
jgi:hypothetical protein